MLHRILGTNCSRLALYRVVQSLIAFLSTGQLTDNEVAFADISQGPHTYTVVATDDDGLVDRSEVHFEGEAMKNIRVYSSLHVLELGETLR